MGSRCVGLVWLAAVSAACSWPPKEQAERARAAAEQFDREMKAESAVWKKQADDEYRNRLLDPGRLTVEASDALIAQLESVDPVERSAAAAALANARGQRGVDPIVKALRAERDERAYSTMVSALDTMQIPRAVEALADALSQPGISDRAREGALRAIIRYGSAMRFASQIRQFYDSLTDPEVRSRVETVIYAIER